MKVIDNEVLKNALVALMDKIHVDKIEVTLTHKTPIKIRNLGSVLNTTEEELEQMNITQMSYLMNKIQVNLNVTDGDKKE